MKNETWIVAAKRTPIGSFQGALASTDVTELGAKAIQGALAESQLDVQKIDEVLMGCVLPAGVGQASLLIECHAARAASAITPATASTSSS